MNQEYSTQRRITNKETGAAYIFDSKVILGQTQQCTVHVGIIEATSELVAVKVIPIAQNDVQLLSLEVNLHKKICTEYNANYDYNIVKFIDAFQTQTNLYIIIEYCDGPTLRKLILTAEGSRFSNQRALECWIPILQAVNLLHSKGLMHRDLKPENVVFKGNKPMLIDFGLLTDKNKAEGYHGTKPYMAPEVLSLETGDVYGKEIDMWSLGVILHEMVFGSRPYTGPPVKMYEEIKKPLRFPEGSSVWKETQDLIMELLKIDPSERITADKVKSHPIMTKFIKRNQEEEAIIEALKSLLKDNVTGPYLKSIMDERKIEVSMEYEGEEKFLAVRETAKETSIKLMVPRAA